MKLERLTDEWLIAALARKWPRLGHSIDPRDRVVADAQMVQDQAVLDALQIRYDEYRDEAGLYLHGLSNQEVLDIKEQTDLRKQMFAVYDQLNDERKAAAALVTAVQAHVASIQAKLQHARASGQEIALEAALKAYEEQSHGTDNQG